MDFDAGAADGAVEVGGGGVFAEAEGEGFELLVEGGGGVVAGAGDAAAVEVDGGEGLEDVVELAAGEGEGDGGVAGDLAGVLEEADAVFVERDAGDGEGVACGCLRGGCGGWLSAGRVRARQRWGGERRVMAAVWRMSGVVLRCGCGLRHRRGGNGSWCGLEFVSWTAECGGSFLP